MANIKKICSWATHRFCRIDHLKVHWKQQGVACKKERVNVLQKSFLSLIPSVSTSHGKMNIFIEVNIVFIIPTHRYYSITFLSKVWIYLRVEIRQCSGYMKALYLLKMLNLVRSVWQWQMNKCVTLGIYHCRPPIKALTKDNNA